MLRGWVNSLGLVLHQEYPEQTGQSPGELPTRAPGQAWGLKKKNLPEIEMRADRNSVGSQSCHTAKAEWAQPGSIFYPSFYHCCPKVTLFCQQTFQPALGRLQRMIQSLVNSAERWFLILGVVVGSTGEGGTTTAAGLGLARKSSSSTLLYVNKSPRLINLAAALPAYTVQIFYLGWK